MSVWAATKAVLKGVGKVLDYVIKDEEGLAGIDRAKLAKSGNVTPHKSTARTYAYQYRGPKDSVWQLAYISHAALDGFTITTNLENLVNHYHGQARLIDYHTKQVIDFMGG